MVNKEKIVNTRPCNRPGVGQPGMPHINHNTTSEMLRSFPPKPPDLLPVRSNVPLVRRLTRRAPKCRTI
eukprot:7868708-Karenia_brevis.AAC.1